MEDRWTIRAQDATLPDEAELVRLVEQIDQGSDLAFERFWRLVETRVDRAVRSTRLMQKLAERPAERADCKQTIALKLRRVLPMYLDYREQKKTGHGSLPSIMRWVAVIINNAAIDFRRMHPEYRRNAGDNELQYRWRTFVHLGLDEGITSRGNADPDGRDPALAISRARQFREMLQWADTNLPAYQARALMRWLYAEDSRQSKAARAALRKLRDQFRGSAS